MERRGRRRAAWPANSPGADAPAAAAFSGWAAALGSARAAALDKTWQAFSDARPFWAKAR